MGTTLVICIGNLARGDDGVGHEVARLMRESEPVPDVVVLSATDLDVAMAEDVAAVDALVIVDAVRRGEPPVDVRALHAGPAPRPTGHGIDPASLLAMSVALWGRCPRAFAVTVAAPEMGHGERLSATATSAALEAVSVIRRIVGQAQTS